MFISLNQMILTFMLQFVHVHIFKRLLIYSCLFHKMNFCEWKYGMDDMLSFGSGRPPLAQGLAWVFLLMARLVIVLLISS